MWIILLADNVTYTLFASSFYEMSIPLVLHLKSPDIKIFKLFSKFINCKNWCQNCTQTNLSAATANILNYI